MQEVSKYQELKDSEQADIDDRPRKYYSKVTIEKVDSTYYMIASEVFDLSEGRVLSNDDLKLLPFHITYRGPEVQYRANQEEAFTLLMRIFINANKMQNPEFVSFPVGE